MKLLLDTCVLAEFAKPKIAPKVEHFMQQTHSESLFISVISLGEINKGIQLLIAGKRKTNLQNWVKTLETMYRDRILAINLDIANLWGDITARAQKKGKIVPAADGLLAATAISHGLHLATRNIPDFQHTSALLVNPWE